MRLGDKVEAALKLVGVTEERVTRWVGRPCGCAVRKERLNQLGAWARRVLGGQTSQAAELLDTIIEGEPQ